MKVQIIAKIELPVYVACDGQGVCMVLSLEDARPLELGDVLNGDFEGPGDLDVTVEDVTQRRSVRVRLEDWACSREHALQRLRQIGATSVVWSLPLEEPPQGASAR